MKKVYVILLLAFVMGCSTDQVLSVEEQLQRDTDAIDKYITDNNITGVIKDPSGLRYRIISNGASTVKPTVANTITVKYAGRLMSNGTLFDSSNSASFVLNNLIEGWRVGFPLLTKGTVATLYIPSKLGYGTQSQPTIPANSNLMFDVTLIDVK